jgi:excisionase family DNA binding protein
VEERLLTIKEVAELLRVAEATVYRLVKRGDLPAIKPSAKITRFRKSDIEAFLNKYTTRG